MFVKEDFNDILYRNNYSSFFIYSSSSYLFKRQTEMKFKTKKEEIKYLRETLKKYKKLSFYDELTELFNRRKLERDLKRLYYDFKRYKHRFTMIMIDIDKFKRINDIKGHLEGDNVLKKVAKIIQNSIRISDRVYRLSGDEFIIILPHSNTKTAQKVIARIKKDCNVKLSYGIGTGQEPKELLNIVDKKMYEDKRK